MTKKMLESALRARQAMSGWPSWKRDHVLTDYTTAQAEARVAEAKDKS
jgi:hypothetical protein